MLNLSSDRGEPIMWAERGLRVRSGGTVGCFDGALVWLVGMRCTAGGWVPHAPQSKTRLPKRLGDVFVIDRHDDVAG